MNASQSLFLNTKPSKLFLRTAIPGGISMLSSSLYGLFESIFIGKFLGTTAFAAFGMAFPLIILNFALAELVGVGSSVPISIFLGQKKDDKANNYFVCSILLTIITGFISGLTLYFASPFALSLMGAKGELLTLAVSYLRICAVFSPVAPLMFCLDNYLRISGKVKTSMTMNIVFSVITVLLELLFIKVFRWGIEGAALGTNISMTICVIWGLIMFIPGKLQLKFVRPKFSVSMFKQIYKNGIAPFLTNISGRLFNIIMNIMLLKFGSEEGVAIYGVIMTLAGMVEQLLYGVIDSLQPAIGYNYGAKEYKRVMKLEKYILTTSASISFIGGGIMFFIPHLIAVPFLEDLSLLPLAIFAIKITSCTFIIRWLGTALQLFFMALEKPMRAMIISISSACVFPLVLIPTLYSLKLTGLWWNYPLSSILSALLALTIFLVSRRKLFSEN